MVTPIKLVGALDLGIELGAFLDTPLESNAPMGSGMVYVNTNDCGSPLGVEPHHVEDPISHEHFMVLALAH